MKKIFLILFNLILIISIQAQEDIEFNIRRHLSNMATDRQNGRKAGSRESKVVAQYILNEFKEIGLNTELQHFSFNNRYQNIIGVMPSKNGKYIVIGAHYDHLGKKFGKIYNGADDNASGISAVIEIARILSKEELQYGIIFIAFDAEEKGLKGSKYFANNNSYDIDLMLSLDMVGHLNHEARLIYEGAATIENGEIHIEESEIENISVKTYGVAKNSGVLTDSFYFTKKGIPSMNIFTGLETSNYHLATDDIETLDIEGIALVAKQVSQFIINIQDSLEPTEVRLYGNHKQRFVISTTLLSGSNGDLISISGMTPWGYSIFGNHYFKYGLGYSLKERKIENGIEFYNSLNTPLSIVSSAKILGLEIIMGFGIYGDISLDSFNGDDFLYEAGSLIEYEFKPYNNISLINAFSLGFVLKTGYINLFNEGFKGENYTTSVTCRLGFHF